MKTMAAPVAPDVSAQVSVAYLDAMLDGGDEDDWIAVVKIRVTGRGTERVVQMRGLSPDGKPLLPDLIGRPGDRIQLTYELLIGR